MNEKASRGAKVSARLLVEERGGVSSQRVAGGFLGEEPEHRQIVAENSRAAFGRLNAFSNCVSGLIAFADGGEDVQFDRRFQRFCVLVCGNGLKKSSGDGWVAGTGDKVREVSGRVRGFADKVRTSTNGFTPAKARTLSCHDEK